MSTLLAFDNIENKHSLYCGEDCRKKFCISLTEHTENVTNFEIKKMLPLTEKQNSCSFSQWIKPQLLFYHK